jgi:hypothetical protein
MAGNHHTPQPAMPYEYRGGAALAFVSWEKNELHKPIMKRNGAKKNAVLLLIFFILFPF